MRYGGRLLERERLKTINCTVGQNKVNGISITQCHEVEEHAHKDVGVVEHEANLNYKNHITQMYGL